MYLLIIIPLLFQQIQCSGYLDLSFKSDFNLKAFVNVSSDSTPLLIPFFISPNKTERLPKIPIRFDEKVSLTILVINHDRLDIDNSTLTTSFDPKQGILSPLTVMFPFSGIKINVGCDEKWYGEKCDVFCCSETASRVGKVCNSFGQLGCPDGKRGLDCGQEISKKWCKCKNNGSCVSSFGKNLREKMQCSCNVGFSGVHCEKEMESIEMMSTYGVDPKKFEIGTAKMLYDSVTDNEFSEVSRPHSSHLLHNLRINDA
ncbi:hypothetical protein B9Z55_016198 [Caenorhabditis nigoni]|uniref:Delta-like protein n=1 Tax=Caenorhabditis nigoni TaxID=1611254 RepID=A0A2G5UDP8_9PELO|nr:hypothetical protein B9Z55_016198 [Caenorhabditis nigoni]